MIDPKDILKNTKKALTKVRRLEQRLPKIAESQRSQKIYRKLVQDRISKTGIDAEGNRLQTDRSKEQGTNAYSKRTMIIRGAKGKQFTYVDLTDTRVYSQSRTLSVQPNYLLFYDGDIKKDGGLISDNFKGMYNSEDDFIDETSGMNTKEAEEWIDIAVMPEVEKTMNEVVELIASY